MSPFVAFMVKLYASEQLFIGQIDSSPTGTISEITGTVRDGTHCMLISKAYEVCAGLTETRAHTHAQAKSKN